MEHPAPTKQVMIVMLLALSASACARAPADTEAQGEGEAATIADRDVPAIRAKLQLEELVDGQRRQQAGYLAALERCQQAGWPATPLSQDQVDRLDTGTVEILFDADHRLVRETRWEWELKEDPGRSCPFEFKEHVHELYTDAKVTGNTGDDGEPWHEEPAPEGILDIAPVDQEGLEEELAQAGWTGSGDSEVAGNACRAWQGEGHEVCMWSGGKQWGFSDGPANYDFGSCFGAYGGGFLNELPLRAEPTDGDGCRIQLQSLSVSKGPLTSNDVTPRTR